MPKSNEEIMNLFIQKLNEKYGLKLNYKEYINYMKMIVDAKSEYDYVMAGNCFKSIGEQLLNGCVQNILDQYKEKGTIDEKSKDAFIGITMFLGQFKELYLKDKLSEENYEKVSIFGKLTQGYAIDIFNNSIEEVLKEKGFDNFSMLDDVSISAQNNSHFASNLKREASYIGATYKDDPRFQKICAGYTVAKNKLSGLGFFKKWFTSEGSKLRKAVNKSEKVIKNVKQYYDNDMKNKDSKYKAQSLNEFVDSSYGKSQMLEEFKNSIILDTSKKHDLRNYAFSPIAAEIRDIYKKFQLERQNEVENEEYKESVTSVHFTENELDEINNNLDDITFEKRQPGDESSTLEGDQKTR